MLPLPKNTRVATNKLLKMIDNDEANAKEMLRTLLGSYMSEAEVKDFAEAEGYLENED